MPSAASDNRGSFGLGGRESGTTSRAAHPLVPTPAHTPPSCFRGTIHPSCSCLGPIPTWPVPMWPVLAWPVPMCVFSPSRRSTSHLGRGPPPLPPEPPLSNLTSHIWDEPTPGKATCRGPRNHMHLGTLFSWGHVGGFPQVHKCAGMETLSSTSELWPRRSCAEKWVCVGGLGTGDREPGAALCPTDPLG